MIGSPKMRYIVIFVVLTLLLAGCELRRDGGDGADAEPIGDLSPTLAPLGADSSDLSGAAPPTVIIVDPTATASTLETGAAQSEQTEPTSQPAVDLSSGSSSQLESEQAVTEPESFVLPEDEVAVLEESTADETTTQEEALTAEETAPQDLTVEQAALEEPVIANAPEDLPTGGPIAANPPASDTVGSYAAPADGTHVVQFGDTLFSISQRYGTTVQALIAANGLTSDVIQEGQVLAIVEGYDSGYSQPNYAPNNYAPGTGQNMMPGIEGNHVVAQGETLFSIAQRYGVSVEAMAGANGIPAPYTIYPGQVLRVGSSDNFGQPNPYNNQNYNTYGQQPDNNGYGSMEENIYGPPTYQQPGYNMPYNDTYAQPGYGSPSGATHIVAAGETLFSIAQLYGLSADSIAAANGISNPNQIAAGQMLYLP